MSVEFRKQLGEVDGYDRSWIPEQKMLAAIVGRAVLDCMERARVTERAVALAWINGDSLEPFSFRWCLMHIFVELEQAENMIKTVRRLVRSRDPRVIERLRWSRSDQPLRGGKWQRLMAKTE